jgi:NAD(P)-dependent dehydrogenase (short-subunit alcohol dehydrogenase family)
LDRWNKMLRTGVWSDVVTSYYAMPLMLAQPQALIVHITLPVGEYRGGWLFYWLAKKAINELTHAMAQDLRPHGVSVVGLAPGWTRTEAVMSDVHPHKRPPPAELQYSESPEYVGRAVVALVTDPGRMARTGTVQETRVLGRRYGFTDVDGRQPERVWPTVRELRTIARNLGIVGYSRMRRADLIAAIEQAESAE